MDEELAPLNKSIRAVGQISDRLCHPSTGWVLGDARDMNLARGQPHHEENVIADRPETGPRFDGKQIGSGHDCPMPLEEVRPGGFPASLGRGLDAVIAQDIGNGIAADLMAEIHQGIAEAGVTSSLIFPGQADHEFYDILLSRWAPRHSSLAGIVLLSDELSVPAQQRLRRDNVRDFLQAVEFHLLRPRRKSDTLVIVEPRPFLAEQFSEHPHFFLQVIDHGLLFVLEPADKTKKDELQRIHGPKLTESTPELNPKPSASAPLNQFRANGFHAN